MKKILYTLLFTLLFVACDKNNDNMDLQAITPAELEIASVSNNLSQDLVLKLVSNLINANIPKAKKGNASNASKSSDYQVLWVFLVDGVRYTTLLDDTNDDLCFGDISASAVYLDNSAGDGSEISVESNIGGVDTVSAVVNGNFAAFFSGASNALIKLTDDLQPAAIANFDASNNATFE